jgi:peptidoglycan/LPS O-acetylase OafA/YrhL
MHSFARTASGSQPGAIPADGTARTNRPVRIAALDGLRGIAIILVLLWHTLTDTQPGPEPVSRLFSLLRLSWSGVDLFFVLSGFLIGGILLDAESSPRYFKTFYVRRAYRILPVYGIAVAIYALRYLHFFRCEPPWARACAFRRIGSRLRLGMCALRPRRSASLRSQFGDWSP